MLKSTVVRFPILAFFAFAAASTPAQETRAQNAAQDTSIQDALNDLPEGTVEERATKLASRIRDDLDAAARYDRRLATASTEDSLVIQRQVFSLQTRAMRDVHEFADVLLEQEEKGPQPELRAQVEGLYVALTPHVWTEISRLRDEIDDVRARRPTTPVGERLALEDEIAERASRLDELHKLSAKHVEKTAKLGLDESLARSELTRSLADRADELSGRIDLALARIDALDARFRDTPDNADVPIMLLAAHRSLATNEASMSAVLDLMDGLELPTEDYRAQLVTSTRDVTTGLLDTGVAANLLSRAWDGFTRWITDNGPPFAVKLFLFMAILVAFRFASRVVRKAAEKSLEATKLRISTLLRRMVVTSLSNLVLFLGLLIALSQLGISLGPLLAGVGVAGFVVGFALQDSLANFAAGMMILIYRPCDVGDLVDVGGVFGKVNQYPHHGQPADHGAEQQDLGRRHQERDCAKDPPRRHDIRDLYSDDIFVVRPWVAVADYWDVYWDVTRAVKMRFDEEGISIPFPQRDVHMYKERVAANGTPETPAGARVPGRAEG